MSYKATAWAYGLPITGSKKSVLIALADMADERATCFPGHERLASMIGRSKSTIERAMKDLESLGLLSREKRHDSRGWRTSDRYQLNLNVTMPSRQIAESANSLEGNVESLPVNLLPPTRQGDDAELSVEPSVEPSVSKSKRGTRISPDWWPSDDLISWAASELPNIDVTGETPNFIDWWISAAGANAVKLDWNRTWKVWMRRQTPARGRSMSKSEAAVEHNLKLLKKYEDQEARG